MTALLITYITGVVINAIIAAMIWYSLKENGELKGILIGVLLFFVALSFVTWLYSLTFVFVGWVRKRILKNKGSDGGKAIPL